MRVAVASTAAVKRRAVTRAFERLDDVVAIETAPSPSQVSTQPQGFREIHAGATHRLEAVCEARPDADVWVSMENGVVQIAPGLWIDLAVVRVKLAETGAVGTATSAGVEVPAAVVARAFAVCDGTVGKALQAAVPGVDHRNPHEELTGGRASREELLAQAVVAAYGIAERK